MPRTVDQGFRDLLKRLTPRDSESLQAQEHRRSIESCLKRHLSISAFFRTGSFGNGTSISGYSDVDYFAEIPPHNQMAGSDTMLQFTRDRLHQCFPQSGVRRRCPAVHVPFGYLATESTEIVPAYLDGTIRGNLRYYRISNCTNGWQRSSPDAHNWYVRHHDVRLSKQLKPLIRFVKAWKYFNDVPISSFFLELWVTKWAESEHDILYEFDMRTVLNKLAESGLASITDPMGVSGIVAPCSTPSQYSVALPRVSTAALYAQNARDASYQGDTRSAFFWWDKVFNGKFPSYY